MMTACSLLLRKGYVCGSPPGAFGLAKSLWDQLMSKVKVQANALLIIWRNALCAGDGASRVGATRPVTDRRKSLQAKMLDTDLFK